MVAGTTSTVGQNWTIIGSKSTGAVFGGDIIFQTSGANAAATVQNTPVEVIRFKSSAAASTNPGAVIAAGALTSSGAGGIGYSTGAGGTVTQGTSRTTGVTLNKTTGQITLFTAAAPSTMNTGTFTVTNSTVAATDTVVACIASGASTSNNYVVTVIGVAGGSFNLAVWSTTGTTSDTVVLNFTVIKGVTG